MIELDKKRRLVEELLSHLDTSQGGDLKKLIEQAKEPKDLDAFAKPKDLSIEKIDVMKPKEDGQDDIDSALEGSPKEEASESPDEEAKEKIPGIMGDEKGDDEQLTDEELAEMLKQYLGH